MGAAMTQSVGPGTYYLEVDGTGLDDLLYGYSDYGSVGRYTLAVSGCPGAVGAATAPSAPVIVAAERDGAAHGLRLVWDGPGDDGGAAVTSYVVTAGGQPVTVAASTHAYTFGGLAPGTPYTLSVYAVNGAGAGPAASRSATTGSFSGTPSPSTSTATPTPTATPSPSATPTTTPTTTPTITPSSNPTVTASPATGGTATPTVTPTATPTGQAYSVPSSPLVGSAKPGRIGHPLTIRVTWHAPASTGGAPLTGYVVAAWKAGHHGKVTRHGTFLVPAGSHHLTLRLPAGRYKFAVAAENFLGTGPRSARTAFVRPR